MDCRQTCSNSSLQLSLHSELCAIMCSAGEVLDERKLIPQEVHRLLEIAASPRRPYIIIYDSSLWAAVYNTYKNACEFFRTAGGVLCGDCASSSGRTPPCSTWSSRQTGPPGKQLQVPSTHCTCWRL